MSEPTSIVLFAGDVADENTRLAMAMAVSYTAANMGYPPHRDCNLSSMGMLWASFVTAAVTRTPDGGVYRTNPIPRPVDIAGGTYATKSVDAAAQAFSQGLYTGDVYLSLSNPKWIPSIDIDMFDPRKGQCTAEFGLCNLRRMPKPPLPPAVSSLASRFVREFRAVFQC